MSVKIMTGTGLTPSNRSQDGGNWYLLSALFYCIQTGIDEHKWDKEGRLGKESYQNQVCVREKESVYILQYMQIYNILLHTWHICIYYYIYHSFISFWHKMANSHEEMIEGPFTSQFQFQSTMAGYDVGMCSGGWHFLISVSSFELATAASGTQRLWKVRTQCEA